MTVRKLRVRCQKAKGRGCTSSGTQCVSLPAEATPGRMGDDSAESKFFLGGAVTPSSASARSLARTLGLFDSLQNLVWLQCRPASQLTEHGTVLFPQIYNLRE